MCIMKCVLDSCTKCVMWGGGMVWCVGRWYGLVCREVVWFGVWGGGIV